MSCPKPSSICPSYNSGVQTRMGTALRARRSLFGVEAAARESCMRRRDSAGVRTGYRPEYSVAYSINIMEGRVCSLTLLDSQAVCSEQNRACFKVEKFAAAYRRSILSVRFTNTQERHRGFR
jgi:hypothetical protein